MRFHPAADAFPLIEGQAFDELVEDIRKRGLIHPIVTFDGQILDGRNRFRACEKADVEPKYDAYLGNDPIGYVISANVSRRHLDESQRAMVAAKLATLKQGARRDLASIDAMSQPEAADRLNVSRPSVQRAAVVLSAEVPELVRAVEEGKVSVSRAAEIAKTLPRAEAQEAAVRIRKGEKEPRAKPTSAKPIRAASAPASTRASGQVQIRELWTESNANERRVIFAVLKILIADPSTYGCLILLAEQLVGKESGEFQWKSPGLTKRMPEALRPR